MTEFLEHINRISIFGKTSRIMLHGMIPAAFFATLLRRYLDSLSESAEYTASSPSVGCLGTSAAIATVGMAVYGIARLSKKRPPEIETPETNQTIRNSAPQKKESSLHVNRKPKPKKVTRKRHKKEKKWFLKHMKHYKTKYGRQIGKLMNQFLGVPFAEPPMAELVDPDESDEENDSGDSFEVLESPPYNGGTDHPKDVVAHVEDSAAPSKDHFEDDGEDSECADYVTKRSSSLDLKDLLRDNFEMHRKKRCTRVGSSRNQRSRSSSGSYKSGCSQETMIRNSRSSSKKRRLSSKRSRSSFRSKEKNSRLISRNSRDYPGVPRKTRSGRCYNRSIS